MAGNHESKVKLGESIRRSEEPACVSKYTPFFGRLVKLDIPSSNGDDEIHHHKQNTLEPVRLAVANEVVHQEDRDEKHNHLECIEVQSLRS